MKSLTSSLRQSFLAGLLVLLPLYITLRILAFLFRLVDGPLGRLLNSLLVATTGRELHVPGLGLVGTVAIVLLVGWLTRRVFFKRILVATDALIDRVPIVRSLYNATRQIVGPFAGNAKQPFSQVVLVEYPRQGQHALGLVAQERISADPDDDRMVVFFPSNHLHLGIPVVVRRQDVTPIDMSVEDAVKFLVSCGVIGDGNLLRSAGGLFRAN